MLFTDESKQRLIELINSIQPAMASKDPANIILPLRLLVATLEVLEEVYDAETINALSEPEIRLFLNSLHSSINEMSAAIQATISLLPESAPSTLIERNEAAVSSLQDLNRQRLELFELIGSLLATENEAAAQQRQIDDLKLRKESLLSVQIQLEQTSIEDLRKEVLALEQSAGPLQSEFLDLQTRLEIKRNLVGPLHKTVETAKAELQSYEAGGKDRDQLLKIIYEFQDALQPHIHKSDDTIKAANETLRHRVEEAKRLLVESKSVLEKMDQAFSSVKQAQALLAAYAEADASVARAVPGVPDAAKEKLTDIERQLSDIRQQLGVIDTQLRQAVERHQQSFASIEQLFL